MERGINGKLFCFVEFDVGIEQEVPAYLEVLFRVQFLLVLVFVHGQHDVVRMGGVFLNLNDVFDIFRYEVR